MSHFLKEDLQALLGEESLMEEELFQEVRTEHRRHYILHDWMGGSHGRDHMYMYTVIMYVHSASL